VRRGFLFLIGATLLWSGNYIAGRVLARQMDPLVLNAIRWTISAVLLWGILRAGGKTLRWRSHWAVYLLLGLLGMVLFSSLTYLGLARLPAVQAGLISGLNPVMIVLLSLWILKETPDRSTWAGVLLAVLGVVILVETKRANWSAHLITGDVSLVLAAWAWALYTVVGKRVAGDPLELTTGAAVMSVIPNWLLSGVGASPSAGHLSAVGWGALIYVSTGPSVVAYWLWNLGVRRVGASRSAPTMNLLPLWTVVLGVGLLHEQLALNQIIGGVIVLAGAWLSGRPRSSARGLAHSAGPPSSIR